MLLLGVALACQTEGPLERRVDALIAKRETLKIADIGPPAVPSLVRALRGPDATPESCSTIVAALEFIGDPRAIPALVRIADEAGRVETTEAVLAHYHSWPYIALRAKEAVTEIMDPAGAKTLRRGNSLSAFPAYPGTEVYDNVLRAKMYYYTDVNAWYEAWRRTYRADHSPGADLVTPGPDPVKGTVSRSIEALRLWPQARKGAQALVQTGSRSVPALVELLEKEDQVPSLQLLAVELLEKIGDRRCVPALVRIADALEIELEHPEDAVTGENFGTVVLRARRAIGVIVEPANRGKFGAWETSDAPPGTAEFNKAVRVQLAYYERVNAWYAQWRKTYVPESYAGR
jgi:hypothetical protein